MARKRKEDTAPASLDSALPSALVVEEAAFASPSEAPLEVAPAQPAASKWRVGETKQVSMFGHMTTITQGDVVSVSEYGPEGIARLREQGVALEPVV